MNGAFITATDTGVGKTFVACALLRAAARRGLRVAAMKPCETGDGDDGAQLMAACAVTYPAITERQDDSHVVRATFHLQDALYGARQGDWPYVDDVLRSYC